MPWKVYGLKYQDYPEYAARITSHYAGDMLIIEELGELSEEEVARIKERLGIEPERRTFELTVRDLTELPLRDMPNLLKLAKSIKGDSKIHVRFVP
ncbi:MAG: hypothetical protein GXO14_05860 [Thermococci archaeon]|nr:hypothetical protein [Thermococci archaeon]